MFSTNSISVAVLSMPCDVALFNRFDNAKVGGKWRVGKLFGISRMKWGGYCMNLHGGENVCLGGCIRDVRKRRPPVS